jgi:rhodanese-related sulfurtransferase
MSDTDEIFQILRKHWKILLKWILRIHDYPEITVDELYDRINSNQPPLMIDTRNVEDYNGTGYSKYGHITNALSIPMLKLESKLVELEEYKEKEIVTMCPGGGLSLAAVDVMREAGFKDVKSLKGGTDLWNKKGYPTTTS